MKFITALNKLMRYGGLKVSKDRAEAVLCSKDGIECVAVIVSDGSGDNGVIKYYGFALRKIGAKHAESFKYCESMTRFWLFLCEIRRSGDLGILTQKAISDDDDS